ncbi:MAG: hypothetical protein U0939_24370 [Pirellulales bacterium]
MPVVVTCACGKSYEAPDALKGKRVKCPACGGAVDVPREQILVAAPPRPIAPTPAPMQAAPVQAASPFGTTAASAFGGANYAAPTYGGANYAAPTYGAPTYAAPTYPAAGYAAPAPAYGAGGYAPAGYATTVTGGKKKSGSNRLLYLLIGGGAFVAVAVGCIALAIIIPAVQAARRKAQEAADMRVMQEDMAQIQNEMNAAMNGTPPAASTPTSNSPGGGALFGGGSGTWERYDGNGFSVEFPGKFKPSSKSQASPVGILTTHIQQHDRSDGSFMIAYSDIPVGDAEFGLIQANGVEKLLDEACDGMARAAGSASVTNRTPISVNSHKGRELSFDGRAAGKSVSVRAKVVLLNKRVLEVMWVGERGKQNQADITRFLNSLNISEPVRTYAAANPFGGGPPTNPAFGSPAAPNFGSPPNPNFGSPPTPNFGSPPTPSYGAPPNSNFGSPPTPNFGSPPGMGGPPGVRPPAGFGAPPGFGSPPGSPGAPGGMGGPRFRGPRP